MNLGSGQFWAFRLGLGWGEAEIFLDLGQVPIEFN